MELICYTREPMEDIIYAARLAYSMHLAYKDGEKIVPFHHNEGLLYAKATSDPETGVLTAKSLKHPWMFEKEDGKFGIVAVRCEANGEDETDSEGCVLVFETVDFVHYTELGLYRLQEKSVVRRVQATFDKEQGGYVFNWMTDADGWMQGVGNPFATVETARGFGGEGCVSVIGSVESVQKADARVTGLQDTTDTKAVCGDVTYTATGSIQTPEGALPGNASLGTELPEGAVLGNSINIPDALGDYLLKKLQVPVCEKVVPYLNGKEVAEAVAVEDLEHVKAAVFYSDGAMVLRKVDWDAQAGEPAQGSETTEVQSGEMTEMQGGRTAGTATGTVHQEYFDFPFTENRADPCCMYRDGKYYYIATNDADGNHTLYMRCADTLAGIVTAEESLILDSTTYEGIGGLLWAPEFHEIDGQLYIFHAATPGEFFWEESHVMKLREGGDPMCKEDWSKPHMVVKKDGTPLCEAGKVISLDMTTFEYEGGIYAMWSQRQFLPVDQGAWLYLAEIDRREPWKLLSDPVCITKPEYGWENNHTFVVEGPYALEKDGQLMITYSGAAVDATYTVGLLKPIMGSDILNPANWLKNNYPLMSSRSAEDEYGPGHNSYLQDENGLTWNFYHGRRGVTGPRSSGARRVHFDIDGEPMLDVVDAVDLPQEMRKVCVKVR